jgi:actin-like ATPase involved in cell morphogenesis
MRVVGLDIGSGYTKCFDGTSRIIFPSIYSYREPGLWEDREGVIEAVGEQALVVAQNPNAVTLYPVIDGKPQHQAFVKLVKEALKRLQIGFFEDVCLVTGLPYESGKDDRERIKNLLRDRLHLKELVAYPQAIGTLFDLDLQSATVINIGHGTTEIVLIEKLNVLGGMSEPLASDYIITSLSNFIQSKHGFKPTTDNLVAFISGKIDVITAFGKNFVHRKDTDAQLQSVVDQSVLDHLAEKIAYDAQYLLTQLPPNLDCATRIILSGGGSLIAGIREAIEQELNCKLLVPSDPIFSNVSGFYKMGRKLYD